MSFGRNSLLAVRPNTGPNLAGYRIELLYSRDSCSIAANRQNRFSHNPSGSHQSEASDDRIAPLDPSEGR